MSCGDAERNLPALKRRLVQAYEILHINDISNNNIAEEAAALRPKTGDADGPPPASFLQHSAYSDQGGREYMEDAHTVHHITAETSCFAVFDGHGGPFVSKYCATHLPGKVEDGLLAAAALGRRADGPAVTASLRAAFTGVDGDLLHSAGREAAKCGSTAAVCVVSRDYITTANCGDSRVVLVRSNNTLPLTIDHTPMRKDERARVRRAGGEVFWSNGLRVMGSLSMTRAIGDHFLRHHGVISEPEVSTVRRCPRDELLILATDGLWNFVTGSDAVAAARRLLARAEAAGVARRAAVHAVPKALTQLALARGGTDNVTVMVVDLRCPRAAAAATAAAAAAAAGPEECRSEPQRATEACGPAAEAARAQRQPLQAQQPQGCLPGLGLSRGAPRSPVHTVTTGGAAAGWPRAPAGAAPGAPRAAVAAPNGMQVEEPEARGCPAAHQQTICYQGLAAALLSAAGNVRQEITAP